MVCAAGHHGPDRWVDSVLRAARRGIRGDEQLLGPQGLPHVWDAFCCIYDDVHRMCRERDYHVQRAFVRGRLPLVLAIILLSRHVWLVHIPIERCVLWTVPCWYRLDVHVCILWMVFAGVVFVVYSDGYVALRWTSNGHV